MRAVLLFVFLVIWTYGYAQTIIRIEPPNWWVGFQNPNLEILLYSDVSLSQLTPELKYPGVSLLAYAVLENSKYLKIDLQISPETVPGIIQIDLVEAGHIKTSVSLPLLQRKKDPGQHQGFTTSDVLYLITPDRFANQSEENDNCPDMEEMIDRADKNGRHGGDIQGVIGNLAYISTLGCTGIWLNPVLENNMPKWSYHGYAITDFYKVDPRFGSNEMYRDLCNEAGNQGLKVIMDMVINHCGLNHWWLSDPPAKDWINYDEQPYTETNHRKTLQPDPYAAQRDIDQLEKGWFVPTMPDLNVTNEVLATYMTQNTIWWIEYAGIDGIRMDTYLYPDKTYMAKWAKAIRSEYPNFTISGEVWYEHPAILAYWQEGNHNRDQYESNLPSVFDFAVQHNLVKSLNTDDTWGSGWIYLFETLGLDFLYPNPKNLVVFADNHDMSRIYAQLGHDIDKMKMALAFVLTTRGIPQLFYGTEILMDSPSNRDDGLVRSDFPGGWKEDKINAFTGEGLSEEQKNMHGFLKTILNWRKKAPAIHHGKLVHYVPEKGVYVYFRYHADQQVMVVLNKNKEPVRLELDRFHDMLQNTKEGVDIITGELIDLQKDLYLHKTGPLIIELRK